VKALLQIRHRPWAALMNETNTAVIARLDRATQYSRDGRVQPISRSVLDRPVKPGDDSLLVAGGLPGFFLARWPR
jgi:hypothetical protein